MSTGKILNANTSAIYISRNYTVTTENKTNFFLIIRPLPSVSDVILK